MKLLFDFIVLLLIFFKYLYVRLLISFGYMNLNRRKTWLISEKRTEARDNGYYMFRFLRNSDIKDNVYYSIVKGTQDESKIVPIGNVVEYNSINHIALYLGSRFLLYCQIDSKPYENIHGIGRLDFLCRSKQVRVYLTHGICKDNVPASYDFRLAGYDLFICGAKPEYDYYKRIYNYPDKNIALTGLCRFDGLENEAVDNLILIMPTFRDWLRTNDSTKAKASESECKLMQESDFFKRYSSLLLNKHFLDVLKRSNCKVYFYLHYTIQPYTHLFQSLDLDKKIIICERGRYDVQDLLKKAKILLTDYSSVAFDFAYMKKPIAYYHFDYDLYRHYHYKEGFFNYSENGVGPIFNNELDLIAWLNKTINNGIILEEPYASRINDFFLYHDTRNCERVFNSIKKF